MAGSSHTFEQNVAAAETALARFEAAPLQHLIAGAASSHLCGDEHISVNIIS